MSYINSNSLRSLNIFNDGFLYSLNSESSQCEQPSDIKMQLYGHQKAVLQCMKDKENELNQGKDISGSRLFSNFGILGDGVGVGKSLMILGHISNLKRFDTLRNAKILTDNGNSNLYSIEEKDLYKDCSNAGCLIVVPHTLYKQWEKYIETQTKLSFYGVKTKAYLEKEKYEKGQLLTKDIVLVSNTLYGKLQAVMDHERVSWKRVFFDEADTLSISSTQSLPRTKFVWLISASWPNLLFPNTTLYFSQNNMTFFQNGNFDPQLVNHINSWRHRDYPGYIWVQQHYHMVSLPFFKSYIVNNNRHRGHLVVRCRDSFIQESISLPPLYTHTIMCRPSVAHRVVAHAISADVRQLLHAGDYTGALEQLGVKSEDSITLVQAVTENRIKELDRLQKTYDFKNSIEYSSPQAKEHALNHLRQKIDGLKDQIKNLRERIENYKEEICPICFDEPQSAVITNCCHRIFCAACILTSLTRANTCPLCRAVIQPNELRSLTKEKKEKTSKKQEANEPLKKTEQLLKTIRDTLAENKDARFLIFSRFDNPLNSIGQDLVNENIRPAVVHGNKDVINRTLESFRKGETRVLLLNSLMAGAGMNITEATHVILLHAMNHEEEKQILGRAYRMGRQGPLHLIRLLHPDEITDTHQVAH
jgi:SNF2 family DNA or RNA helicase